MDSTLKNIFLSRIRILVLPISCIDALIAKLPRTVEQNVYPGSNPDLGWEIFCKIGSIPYFCNIYIYEELRERQ